ncbi:unnamed protein product [Durusdinium trenchii]|uniref:Ion transport domain-containing protein n=1 Tax=Durusdinium trenchii TaxID=1381693 RepID=A0ABP0JFP0_9DINO
MDDRLHRFSGVGTRRWTDTERRLEVFSAFERLHAGRGGDAHFQKLETTVSEKPFEPLGDICPEAEIEQKVSIVSSESSAPQISQTRRMSDGKKGRDVEMAGALSTTPSAMLAHGGQLGFQKFVSRTSRYIDMIAGILVLLNSMVMMLELEMEGRAVGFILGHEATAIGISGLGDGSTWSLADVEPTFQVLDTAFVYIFLLELLLRILAEGRQFFRDCANWFDTVLVIVGLVDVWIIVPFASGGGTSDPQNIMMMRLFRAVKCLRAIRMVRTFRLFRGLNLLVKACQCFLPSLGWSMVLLVVFMSMGTLIMGNLLRDFIMDSSKSLEDRVWIWNRYGAAYRAMWTLYEVTFAGNWPTNARPVLERVSHSYVFFFIVYITIIVFAVIRVISAIFLKDTLDAAQNDAEALVVDRLSKKASYVRKLEQIFKAIDNTSDGMVTEEKLSTILANPMVVAYFQTLDVDVMDSTALFHLIDNGHWHSIRSSGRVFSLLVQARSR